MEFLHKAKYLEFMVKTNLGLEVMNSWRENLEWKQRLHQQHNTTNKYRRVWLGTDPVCAYFKHLLN